MHDLAPGSDSLGAEELLRQALTGTDLAFQQVARLCEDEGIAARLLRSLMNRRAQVDAWLAYLAELHPALAKSTLDGSVQIRR